MKTRAFYDSFAEVFLDGEVHGRGHHAADVGVGGPGLERGEGPPEHILRWEDDGGQAYAAQVAPQPAEADAIHKTDVTTRHTLYDDGIEPRAFSTRAMSLVHHPTTKENLHDQDKT